MAGNGSHLLTSLAEAERVLASARPKRPMSAFDMFAASLKRQYNIKDDAINLERVMQLVTEAWGTLPPNEKAPFEARARQDMQRYLEEERIYDQMQLQYSRLKQMAQDCGVLHLHQAQQAQPQPHQQQQQPQPQQMLPGPNPAQGLLNAYNQAVAAYRQQQMPQQQQMSHQQSLAQRYAMFAAQQAQQAQAQQAAAAAQRRQQQEAMRRQYQQEQQRQQEEKMRKIKERERKQREKQQRIQAQQQRIISSKPFPGYTDSVDNAASRVKMPKPEPKAYLIPLSNIDSAEKPRAVGPDGPFGPPPQTVLITCQGVNGILNLGEQRVICECSSCKDRPEAQRAMTCTQFEVHAGSASAKKWKMSLKVRPGTQPDVPLESGGIQVGKWLEMRSIEMGKPMYRSAPNVLVPVSADSQMVVPPERTYTSQRLAAKQAQRLEGRKGGDDEDFYMSDFSEDEDGVKVGGEESDDEADPKRGRIIAATARVTSVAAPPLPLAHSAAAYYYQQQQQQHQVQNRGYVFSPPAPKTKQQAQQYSYQRQQEHQEAAYYERPRYQPTGGRGGRGGAAGGTGAGAGGTNQQKITQHTPWRDANEGNFTPINVRWSGERCSVCDADTDYDYDQLIMCDMCGITVHQSCYGVQEVPGVEDMWLCRACELREEGRAAPQCCLCPVAGGALKPTTLSGIWCHTACLQWVPEVTVDDPDLMEPVNGIRSIQRERWELLCSLCKQRMGAKIQCQSCYTAYHPLCARIAGFVMEISDGPEGPDGPVICTSYCARHGQPKPHLSGVRKVEESETGGDLPDALEDPALCNAQPYQLPKAAPLPKCAAGCARCTPLTVGWVRRQHGTGTGATTEAGFWIPEQKTEESSFATLGGSGKRPIGAAAAAAGDGNETADSQEPTVGGGPSRQPSGVVSAGVVEAAAAPAAAEEPIEVKRSSRLQLKRSYSLGPGADGGGEGEDAEGQNGNAGGASADGAAAAAGAASASPAAGNGAAVLYHKAESPPGMHAIETSLRPAAKKPSTTNGERPPAKLRKLNSLQLDSAAANTLQDKAASGIPLVAGPQALVAGKPPAALVGSWCRVWWPEDSEWYIGVIREYAPIKGQFRVWYEVDCEAEWIDLHREARNGRFQLLEGENRTQWPAPPNAPTPPDEINNDRAGVAPAVMTPAAPLAAPTAVQVATVEDAVMVDVAAAAEKEKAASEAAAEVEAVAVVMEQAKSTAAGGNEAADRSALPNGNHEGAEGASAGTASEGKERKKDSEAAADVEAQVADMVEKVEEVAANGDTAEKPAQVETIVINDDDNDGSHPNGAAPAPVEAAKPEKIKEEQQYAAGIVSEIAVPQGPAEGADAIGRKVGVFYEEDGRFYYGTIRSYRSDKGHMVLFDNGTVDWVDVKNTKIDWSGTRAVKKSGGGGAANAETRAHILSKPLPANVPESIPVVCNGTRGIFYLRKMTVIVSQTGAEMTPTEFERSSGRAAAKKWKSSIRLDKGSGVPGVTMEAWLISMGIDEARPPRPSRGTLDTIRRQQRSIGGQSAAQGGAAGGAAGGAGGSPGGGASRSGGLRSKPGHRVGCMCVICKQARRSGKVWSGMVQKSKQGGAAEAKFNAGGGKYDSVHDPAVLRYGKRAYLDALPQVVGAGVRPPLLYQVPPSRCWAPGEWAAHRLRYHIARDAKRTGDAPPPALAQAAPPVLLAGGGTAVLDDNMAASVSLGPGATGGGRTLTLKEKLELCNATEHERLTFGKSGIHGWGLFAKVPIRQDAMVVEFRGELLRRSVADAREAQYTAEGTDCYIFNLDDDVVLDATRAGTIARFTNHSCSPSLYTKILALDGELRLAFFARVNIAPGQELTYNYRFKAEEGEERIPCSCGAPACSGYLN